jgi:putative ABC transport system permease protein
VRGFLHLFARLNVRSAAGNPLRALLTLGGVAAGVALLFSIDVMNSTLRYSIDATARGLSGDAQLEVAARAPSGLPWRTVPLIATTEGVEHVAPVIRSFARVSGPRGTRRALVLGVTPEIGELLGTDVTVGAATRNPSAFAALLSPRLLDAVGGDQVRIETPRGPAPLSIEGRLERAPFAAINGGLFAVVALPVAQALFDRGPTVDSIYVRTRPNALLRVRAALERDLAGAALVGPPGGLAKAYRRTYESIAQLTSLAGMVALFVALFVVLNTMSMSLLERRRQLATAVAFGASRRQVFAAFLAEAAVFGIVASALGLALGLLLARTLVERAASGYTLLPISAAGSLHVTATDVLASALGGPLIAIVGAFLPARRILDLAPIESLLPEASYEWPSYRRPRSHAVLVAGGALALVVGLCGVVLYSRYRGEAWLGNASLLVTLAGVMLLLPYVVPRAARLLRPPLARAFGLLGRLSADSLLKNPGRTTLTVGALAVSASMVVGVGAAMKSFEAEIVRAANGWYQAPLFVSARSLVGITSDQPLPGDLARLFERVPGVRAAYPWRYAMLDLGGRQAVVYAVPARAAERNGDGVLSIPPGTDPRTLVRALARGEAAVSRYTADQRGLAVGDTLSLPTPRGWREFRVGALFDDLVSFDSLYLDYSTYARLWGDRQADRFAIVVEDGADPASVRQGLQQLINERRLPAEVAEKQDLVAAVLDTVRGYFSLARAIELAALVIAALIIANTMLTAVLERRWEFALQRAVGMGSRQLRRTVLLEAAAIGLLGGATAIAIGLGIGFVITRAMEIRFAWQIAFEPDLLLVAAAIPAGIVVAAGAALYPSRLATRTPIVTALRFE